MGTRIATVVVQSQAAAMLAWPRTLLLDHAWCFLLSNDDDPNDDGLIINSFLGEGGGERCAPAHY
jgi:hypothetical protein